MSGFNCLNLVTTRVNGHFWRCMLKHARRQLRYFKSQLYNAFVISDVCNRSLCVINFLKLINWDGQKPRAFTIISLSLWLSVVVVFLFGVVLGFNITCLAKFPCKLIYQLYHSFIHSFIFPVYLDCNSGYSGTPLILSPIAQKNLVVLTRLFFFTRKCMVVLPGDQNSGRNNELTVRRGSTVPR